MTCLGKKGVEKPGLASSGAWGFTGGIEHHLPIRRNCEQRLWEGSPHRGGPALKNLNPFVASGKEWECRGPGVPSGGEARWSLGEEKEKGDHHQRSY